MPRILSITISAEHVDRIKEMFRQVLGRDLTPEEEQYLGISPVPPAESAITKNDKTTQ